MCDTYVSLASATKDKTVIFGKNSDRLKTEAQLITYAPRTKYSKGEELKCTHITIPQVSETAAILLSQPYWMWGAEMGVNEYGVAIGNESVSTKEPLKEIGLLGMDLLRLGLERGKTAKRALNIITDLLERYGQGGSHHIDGANYHNSMIIADPNEAYVLEAAGEFWIAEIVNDVRSISNDLSIRGKGDFRKRGIIQHAIEKEYCRDDSDFDFTTTFSTHRYPSRYECSMEQLTEKKGNITVDLMMEFLREHKRANICMHGRPSHSAGSLVSHLKQDYKSIHWFTGSIYPCLGIFKPYTFPADGLKFSEEKPNPYSEINSDWFWSRHSKFIKPYKVNPIKEKPERDAYYKKLRSIENDLLIKVNEVVLQETKISEEDFIKKIKEINLDAWKMSEEMIK